MKKIVSHLRHGVAFWTWALIINSFAPALLIIPFYVWALPIWPLILWMAIGFVGSSYFFMVKNHRLDDAEQIYFAKGELLNETNN